MTTFNAYAATTAHGSLEPFSFDPGPIGPEEVEIKVSHCGLCHSDLSMLENEWGMTNYPFVPGHEVTGTVVAMGEAAKGLKIGQRVGLGWTAHSCLHTYAPLVRGLLSDATVASPIAFAPSGRGFVLCPMRSTSQKSDHSSAGASLYLRPY
jgi:NADPH:quinone reductase-like Zn-dependent oxidoreductase